MCINYYSDLLIFLKINNKLIIIFSWKFNVFLKDSYINFIENSFLCLIFSSLRYNNYTSFCYVLYNKEILLFSLKVGSNNIATNSSFIANLNFATILGSFPTLLCSRFFLRFLALKQIQIPRDSFQIEETFLKKQKREKFKKYCICSEYFWFLFFFSFN